MALATFLGVSAGRAQDTVGTNTISGTVFFDENGFGGFFGDPPIPGIIVRLYYDPNADGLLNDGEAPSMVTVTDEFGGYTFSSVPDGSVIVEQLDPPGAFSTNDVEGAFFDSMAAYTLPDLSASFGVDFWDSGVLFPAIDGRVLTDTDNSGTITAGDQALSGATVALYVDTDGGGSLDSGDFQLNSGVTGAQGEFSFSGYPSGSYLLVETDPANASSVTDSDGAAANDANTIAVTLGAGYSVGNIFLDQSPGISGRVLHDLDGDGALGDPDPGVGGVTVQLWLDTDDNGQFDSTTDTLVTSVVTDGEGDYSFFGLADDRYVVVELDPSGATSTNDWDDTPAGAAGTDNSIAVNLTGGNVFPGRDFLDTGVSTAAITGTVRDDLFDDGDLAADYPGLGGVFLRLFTDPDLDGDPADGQLVMSTFSQVGGAYAFPNLAPGSYVVEETDPAGSFSTNDADNDPQGPAGTDNYLSVTLGGSDVNGADFLDYGLFPVAIRGGVFDDDDATNNDTLGPEDPPIGAVNVVVRIDANRNGLADTLEPRVGSTFTLSDGSYSFGGLVEGSYVITQIDPLGATSEDDTDGDPSDSNIGVLLGQSDSTGNDFLDDGVVSSSISGSVTDGSTGLTGVELTLTNPDGDVIDTVYSSTDGAYQIPNLPAGPYVIRETNPPGVTAGSDSDGGDPDVTALTLGATPATGTDFIDTGARSALVSGTVSEDDPNNGAIDESDPGVGANVVRLVLDADGNGVGGATEPVLAETLTRTDGYFVFPHVVDGSYAVVEVNSPASISVIDADGSANGKDNIAVTLSGGVDSTGNDFLDDFVNEASLSGTVTDGLNPLAGVVLTLFTDGGIEVDRAATDETGRYEFPDLVFGNYSVIESDPPGTTGGSDMDGSGNGDNQVDVTVTIVGANDLDFTDTIAPAQLHAISGQVRDDVDGDGDPADTEDRPVAGVELVLYRDADGDGAGRPIEEVGRFATTADGVYQFTPLTEGGYLVLESSLMNSSPDSANLGRSTSTADTGADNGDPDLIPVTLAATDSTSNDFLDAIEPGGHFYNVDTGQILTGGSITVTDGLGTPAEVTQTGEDGRYSFRTTAADTYTIEVTPPLGYEIDPTRPVAGAGFDPTGLSSPVSIGSGENPATPGFLGDWSTSANPYYLRFALSPGDPTVVSNNIPLRLAQALSFSSFVVVNALTGADAQPVPDATGTGGNPDGDIDSNLMEHALAGDPGTGVVTHVPFSIELVNHATGRIDATFGRPIGVTDVIYTVEGRDSLAGNGADGQGWFTIGSIAAGAAPAGPFISVDEGDGTETIILPNLQTAPGLSSGFGLVRLRVDLDADQDGVPDTLPSDGTEATDTSKTLGWQATTYNSGQIATFGSPFREAPVFSGVIGSATASSLDVSGSAGESDLTSVIPGGGTHYLQLTSGPREGERFDILSTTSSTIVLQGDLEVFSAADGVDSLNTSNGIPPNTDLSGARFTVQPHRTIDQLFDKNSSFLGQENIDPNLAARLILYNNRIDTPRFDSLILADTTPVKWIYSYDLGGQSDQGAKRIGTCEGVYIEPKQGNVTLVTLGVVADHDVAVALREGYNAAGAPYPLTQSVSTRGYTAANGLPASIDPNTAASLQFWLGDEVVDAGAAYVRNYRGYMHLDTGTDTFWTDINDFSLPNMDAVIEFPSHRAAILSLPPGQNLRPFVHPQPTMP